MPTDEQFFSGHPERQAHIRVPRKELAKDRQRAVRYLDEAELQFRSLGPHEASQRRIVVYRVPADNPMAEEGKQQLLTIPILAFEGEVIPDTDEVLLPLIDEIMKGQVGGA
jgi:hypothetical protein